MTDPSPSRRAFLATASAGALTAAGLAPAELFGKAADSPGASTADSTPGVRPANGVQSTHGAQLARGLAAPGDFAFAPGLTYLQTGSLGPTPRPVMERTSAAWQQLQQNPSAFGFGDLQREMESVRSLAAEFAGCRPHELVLTSNTTQGMNWVAQGLTLKAGDRILTTDQEHPGGRVCWDHLVRRYGVELDVVVIPPDEHDAQNLIDLMSRAFTPGTRVMSVSHILSSTGLRMPVAELSALARSRGCISVIDGAQAMGTGPVSVRQIGCDVYATSGHKWILGPPGTGLLYLSEEVQDVVDPIALQSGRAAYSASSGVRSMPAMIGLGAAMEYLDAIGMQKLEAHNLALRKRLFAELQNVPGLEVVSAPDGPLATSMLSYRLPDAIESGVLQQKMRQERKIELKVVPGNLFNGHRVSLHLFNSEEDVERLVEGLRAELG